LSDAELEVYHLLMRGMSNREIAQALGITVGAADIRILRTCRDLGAENVRELMAKRIAELEARVAELETRLGAKAE
jgi:DNA-binding CsgD family transcriptional regulator